MPSAARANAFVLRHPNDLVGLPLDEQDLTDGICIRPQPGSQDLIDDHRLPIMARAVPVQHRAQAARIRRIPIEPQLHANQPLTQLIHGPGHEQSAFGDEGGVTGICVLSTSHCSIHTWPLRPFFVMDVYSCRDFDPADRLAALAALEDAETKGEVLTGVLYVNTHKPTFTDLLNLSEEPLATLPEAKIRPSRAVLDELMEQLR